MDRIDALEGNVRELDMKNDETNEKLKKQASEIQQILHDCNETVSAHGLDVVLQNDTSFNEEGMATNV